MTDNPEPQVAGGYPSSEPESLDVRFRHQANGSWASINSADFHTCVTCGACVVEMHGSYAARQIHDWWHSMSESGES